MFKLALNAGHGYETAGKRCLKALDPNETREYALNKRIADKIEAALAGYDGIEVLRIDNGTDISISKRAKAANTFGADFYLAIHHNAGISGGSGGGVEAYVYLKVDDTTLEWQKALYNKIIEKTDLKGNRSQPLRSANFGELRETNMPAVLLECGFMDSTTDTPIILTEDFADKVAAACVEVIAERAQLTKKQASPTASAPTATPKPADEKISVTYQVWDDVKNKWLPNVKDLTDYAGIFGHDVCAVFANLSKGNITYKVHTKGGNWLPEVTNRTDYAGIFNKPIDGLMMRTDTGKTIHYAVHLRRQGRWLPFVTGYNTADSNNGYAGILGQEIDAIKIYID